MKKREMWLDYIRAFGCIAVAGTHFVESMYKAGMMHNEILFRIIERTIYFIPVPAFFFCSGYLYQSGKPVNSKESYLANIKNKLINLGVPYVFFVLLTVLMKVLMENSVNTPVEEPLWKQLLIAPPGQMWFLLILFMCFLFIPTISQKNLPWIIGAGIALKLFHITGIPQNLEIIEIEFLGQAIWFIAGMVVCYLQVKPDIKWVLIGLLSIPPMIWNYFREGYNLPIQTVISFFGIALMAGVCMFLKGKHKILELLSQYMLQIYLLHTMCAAFVRILLFKLQITSGTVHIAIGLP